MRWNNNKESDFCERRSPLGRYERKTGSYLLHKLWNALKLFTIPDKCFLSPSTFIPSVLLFPPVNSYRRFLIHKVCETITANQPRALTTFSIGVGEQRRTVICHRYQLLVDLKSVSLKRFVTFFLLYFCQLSHFNSSLFTQLQSFSFNFPTRINALSPSDIGN